MADISDLEQQVFNMKLKVHEYELRLSEVNLHGLTGERVQAENKTLKERVGSLESEKVQHKEKISTLTDICVKTRVAIEKLQSEVGTLSSAHERDNLRITHLKTKEESMIERIHQLETEVNQLGAAKEDLKQARQRIAKIESENEELTNQVASVSAKLSDYEKIKEDLETTTQSLSAVTQSRDKLSEELKLKEEMLERINQEKEELMGEAAKKVQLELALKGDELEGSFKASCAEYEKKIIELEHTKRALEEMKTSIEVECERYKALFQKSESAEKDLRKNYAILQADLRTFKSREEVNLRSVREDFEKQKRELVDFQEQKLAELEVAHKGAADDAAGRELKLRETIDRLRKEIRNKSSEAHSRVAVLTQELEGLRKKWQASITNKRTSQRSQDSRPKKRLSLESSVSYASGSNRSACDNKAVAGQTSSENAANNSLKPKRRKKTEMKSKPVASRFMQRKERVR